MRKLVRRSLYIALVVGLLFLIWVLAFSIDSEHQRSIDLGGGVILVETVHIFRSAFTQIADSGGSAILPMPYRNESVIHQKVLRNGTVMWEGPSDKIYNISVSPDRHYVLVWDQVRTEWWRAYDISTGNYIELYLPKHPGIGDGMVPLKFGWWSEDSTQFHAVIEGSEVEPVNQWMKYRETYLVDPSNGSFYKQNHCHQLDPLNPHPPYFRPNWDNTPCAGKYED